MASLILSQYRSMQVYSPMMSGIPQKLQILANSSASIQFKEASKKKKIRNKGAYISRSSRQIYVNSLENRLHSNDQDIKKKKKSIAEAVAEIDELKNIEMRMLGKLILKDC